MNEIDLIILNFEEIRRRSIKVWKAIPDDFLDWKPDVEALSCKEMIRHVLESEFYYHQFIINRGSHNLSVKNPFENIPFQSVEEELSFARTYREDFIRDIQTFNNSDLKDIKIDRSNVGYIRELGDMLLRIAYHESVHTGQLLDYMRTMGIERPDIWD